MVNPPASAEKESLAVWCQAERLHQRPVLTDEMAEWPVWLVWHQD
jgi:hypothetical protein